MTNKTKKATKKVTKQKAPFVEKQDVETNDVVATDVVEKEVVGTDAAQPAVVEAPVVINPVKVVANYPVYKLNVGESIQLWGVPFTVEETSDGESLRLVAEVDEALAENMKGAGRARGFTGKSGTRTLGK